MDLIQLKYFVGITSSPTMLQAARALNVSQSALSVSMKKLEACLLYTSHPADGDPLHGGGAAHHGGDNLRLGVQHPVHFDKDQADQLPGLLRGEDAPVQVGAVVGLSLIHI